MVSSLVASSLLWTFLCLSLPACDAVFCLTLNSTGNITDQMLTCNLETFGFGSSTGVFDLSTWNQATYDKAFLYSKGNSQFYKSIIGEVKIINSKLTAVTLDFRKDATKSFGANILRNQHLSELRITVEDSNGKVEVHGNKLLKKKWVKLIKNLNATSKDVQEAGECMPVATLSSLDELSYCKHIKGNVVIDGSTKIARVNGTKRLTKFDGCLSVKNSNVDTLDFLGAITHVTCSARHVVEGNQKLCKYSRDLERIRGWGNATIGNNMDCDQECDFTKAKSKAPEDKCNVFKGDLKIDQTVDIGAMKSLLDRIEKLKGRLIVENTRLAKFDLLPKLQSIEAMNPDHSAIDVIGNKNLAKFELPALKKIVMDPDTKHFPLDMEKNGNFTFTWEEFDRWNKMTGVEHHMLPHEDAPATTTPTTPAPTTMTTTLSARDKAIVASNAQRQEDNEQTEMFNKTALIVGAAIFAALLLIFPLAAFFCYRRNWRNDPQYEKREEHRQKKHNVVKPKTATCSSVAKEKQKPEPKEVKPLEEKKAVAVEDKEKMLNSEQSKFVGLQRQSDEYAWKSKMDESQFCLAKLLPYEPPYLMTEGIDFAKADTVPEEKMTQNVDVYKYKVNFTTMFYAPSELWDEEEDEEESFEPLDSLDEQGMILHLLTKTNRWLFQQPKVVVKWLDEVTKWMETNAKAMAQIEGPVNFVGAVNGSLADLQVILNMDPTGQAKANNIHPAFYYKWVFLGNYFEKGYYSIECLLLLFLLAKRFPKRFVLLRERHEAQMMYPSQCLFKEMLDSKLYGPYGAMVVYYKIKKLIDCLPFACLVNNQIFCTHGGISHKLTSAKETSLVELFGNIKMPTHTYMKAFRDPKTWYPGYRSVKWWNEYRCKSRTEQANCDAPKEAQTIVERRNADHMFEPMMVELDKKIAEAMEKSAGAAEINDTPYLDDCLWSDPIPALAIPSNRSYRGVYFDQRELDAFRDKFKISMVIRGHEELGCKVNADATLWSMLANDNDDLWSRDRVPLKKLSVRPSERRGRITGVLRLNADSTLTVMMFRWTEKDEHVTDSGASGKAPTDINDLSLDYWLNRQVEEHRRYEELVKERKKNEKYMELLNYRGPPRTKPLRPWLKKQPGKQ